MGRVSRHNGILSQWLRWAAARLMPQRWACAYRPAWHISTQPNPSTIPYPNADQSSWGLSCTLPTYLVPRQFVGSVNTVPPKGNPITLALISAGQSTDIPITLCDLMATSNVVILLIGLHGSGKSTFAGKVIGTDVKKSADGGLSPSKCTSYPVSTSTYLLAPPFSPFSPFLRWTTMCLTWDASTSRPGTYG